MRGGPYRSASQSHSAYVANPSLSQMSRHRSTARFPCQIRLLSCCPTGATSDDLLWRGLAMRSSRGTSLGKPCSIKPCSDCPSMAAGSVGDAALGNKFFALTVDNAKAVKWLSQGAQPTERVAKLLEVSGAMADFKAAEKAGK